MRHQIAAFFTQKESEAYSILVACLVVNGLKYIPDGLCGQMFGVIVALGRQREGGKILLSTAWFVMIPAAFVFAFLFDLGVVGLIYGALCTYTLQAGLLGVFIYRQDWEQISQEAIERSKGGEIRVSERDDEY